MEELERYNRSFDEHIESIEEEAESRLQLFRQQCIRNFIDKLTRQDEEWEQTFRDLLQRSRECDMPELRSVSFAEKPSIRIIDDQPISLTIKDQKSEDTASSESCLKTATNPSPVKPEEQVHQDSAPRDGNQADNDRTEAPGKPKIVSRKSDDPFPSEAADLFTNSLAVKEFSRLLEQQERNRKLFEEINIDPSLKPFKNQLNLFIRTQINSISNTDHQHLMTKVQLLVNLFSGRGVPFQERIINASLHPQGQFFAMDLAAQTFVTVGTRLVNSVPAIAKSMATVINGIIKNNFPIFKDLILGHLQERCPYTIPTYPQSSDFGDQSQSEAQVKYKVACGYSYDIKTRVLESEDKYLARMRSMVLIFACILMAQDSKGQAWTWLASFLSLRPEPVITPTVLQAFLQESSRTLHMTFRRQYQKLHTFMSSVYVKMIEDVTKQASEKQPLIKLKNQLADKA